MNVTRRELLQGTGALLVAFALPRDIFAQAAADSRLGDLDAWLAVDGAGKVTAYCGKVELGTGIQTALGQLVADELDVPFERVLVVMGDTKLCPNQGPTVGSASLARGGPQIRKAAAQARRTLLTLAAQRFGVAPARLSVTDGTINSDDGRSVSYAALIGNRKFEQQIAPDTQPKAASQLRVIGQSVPRVELAAKVCGSHPYIHNLSVPGMLHGRVVRPSMPGATVQSVSDSLPDLPGNIRVLRQGGFVGVVAEREEHAIAAARALKVAWKQGPALPSMAAMPAALRAAPAEDRTLADTGDVEAVLASASVTLAADYYVAHQMHASIGPSCAIADVTQDSATIWSPTQSSFITRDNIAALLGLPAQQVRLIWTEGSGCYGHNGADDCTADAALLSQLAGKPVRVQWMRHDEHGNEPSGAAMVMAVRGGLDDDGRVVAWDYQVWSPSHIGRPAPDGGNTLAGAQLGKKGRSIVGGGDRNARCSYVFRSSRVLIHQLQASPALRVSSLRGLGSPQNTFANECFMDELAARAQADPIAFRLRHLQDPRAVAVLEAVAKLAGWDTRPSPQAMKTASGRGVGFVHYDNSSTYVAVIARVTIERASGKVRVPYVAVAHDCGLIVNPDGVRNQIEGNVIQGISRALREEVQFDAASVTNLDWHGYPILRFADVPEEIAITLIDRPDQPMLGAGEGATSPVAAAIANAIFDATGRRLRQLPLSTDRVQAALA